MTLLFLEHGMPHEHGISLQDFNIKSFKALAIPLIEIPSGKELCRPSAIFHGIFIGSPTQSKYQS
jgi:hypothetical protein